MARRWHSILVTPMTSHLFGQLSIRSLQFLSRHLGRVSAHQLLNVWRQVVLLLLTPLLLLLFAPQLRLLILLPAQSDGGWCVTVCLIVFRYLSTLEGMGFRVVRCTVVWHLH